ncbi:MAG: hypothetical protein AAF710_08790 [Planctomycetota bacterium]
MTTQAPAEPVGTRRGVEWLNLRLSLPGDWEVVRHAVSTRKGALTLADRRRQRMQVMWTACGARPDVGAMLTAYRVQQATRVRDLGGDLLAGWRGVCRVTETDDGERSWLWRAASYDAGSRRLVEAVWTGEGEAAFAAGAGVLEALEVLGPAEAARRVRAFGLDVRHPAGWRLDGAAVRPMDVELRWADDAQRVVRVWRRAGASAWGGDDAGRALRELAGVPRGTALVHDDETAAAGWDVPGPRGRRLVGRHRVASASAWTEAERDAACCVTVEGLTRLGVTLDGWAVNGRGVAG